MRCYTFGNYYMSSIQQGIQAAHSISELFVKYYDFELDDNSSVLEQERYFIKESLYDWAENHKTMVCLNGGALGDLKNIRELMLDPENKYAWSTFYEDEHSLGEILTNIAIILPESIYDSAAKIRSGEYLLDGNKVYEEKFVMNLTDFEKKLIQLLNSSQLAR